MKHISMLLVLILLAEVFFTFPALAYDKLEKNMSGPDVMNMQLALKSLGYSIDADGKYGALTAKVVKAFQRAHSLTVDGVAGNQTLTALYLLAPAYAPEKNGGATDIPFTTPTAAPSVPSADMAVAVSPGGLNLREAASASARVITVIPNGDRVLVVQRGNDWCAVLHDGTAGYVMTAYLSFSQSVSTPAPTSEPTAPPAASPGMVQALVTTGGGSLNLREMASTAGKVLLTIPNGAWVTVTVRGSYWSAVIYQGQSGYVMSRFLSFGAEIPAALPDQQPTVLPTAAPTAAPDFGVVTAYVTTGGGSLNLREKAGSGAKVLTTIPNGTYLTVSSRGSAWSAVNYNGIAGYVMTSFLSFSDTSAPVPTAAPTAAPEPGGSTSTAGTALVTTSGGGLNLRLSASASAKVIAVIPNASIVAVSSRGASWSAVAYNGISGYVMSQYLSFLGGVPIGDPNEEEEDPSAFTRILKKGMTGADVTWVQNRLVELGYTVAVTNLYDDATFSAVKAFQSKNGLTADGLAGEQTFSILKSENARKADAAPLSYATLRIDNTGDGVRQIQTDLQKLGYPVTVNGSYDVATHNAVVAFQQRNGLVISGIADALTRQVLHSGGGKTYSTPVETLPANEGWIQGPAVSELKLLHWQDEIKPNVKAGQTFTVFDPNTHLSWKLVFYSLGRHADSQPASWRDTQIMNRSFGNTSWTIHPVYVLLPEGQWTLATMHNRPHLYGTIMDNGFGGHLCVHFLRDMEEAQKNDPNYGVNNQITLRNAWKALTGETVE